MRPADSWSVFHPRISQMAGKTLLLIFQYASNLLTRMSSFLHDTTHQIRACLMSFSYIFFDEMQAKIGRMKECEVTLLRLRGKIANISHEMAEIRVTCFDPIN